MTAAVEPSAMHPVKRELWRLLAGVTLCALTLLVSYMIMELLLHRMQRTQDEFHAEALSMGAELSSTIASMSLPPGVSSSAVERLDDEVAFVSSVTRSFGRARALLGSLIELHQRESEPEFARSLARLVRANEQLQAIDRSHRGNPIELARAVIVQPVYAAIVVQQTQRLHERASQRLRDRQAAFQRLFFGLFVFMCAALGLGLAIQLRRSLRGIDGILERERDARERAAAVLAAVPDLWLVVDATGRMLEVSHTDHPDLDTEWVNLKGQPLRLVPAAASPSAGNILASGSPSRMQSLEYEVAPDERGVRTFEARLVPAGNGQWLYLSRDISERKRAERALAQSKEELERQVALRTAQLSIARDTAERANRAKSEFLSRMSHELRTPMNAVLGFAQLLGFDSSLSQQHRQALDHILRAGKHLLHLINDVLDLAQVESGRLTLSPEPLSVEEIVNEVIALMKPQAQSQRVSLESTPMAGMVVRGDRLRVKQILLNLASNAVKYNRPDGWVRFHARRADDGKTRIVVEDSGQGIAQADQLKLFEPFSRLGAEQSAIEGTGIGLSISKRLVELMGGRIGVESAQGLGSRFWIELASDLRAPPPNDPETRPGKLALSPSSKPACVLYVEDNPDNLALVVQIVERHPSLRLIAAPSAALGFELARSHRPDLILLDIHLPDGDGYALLERLRANDATRSIPAVAVSANAMPHEETRAREAGFAAYITKPIDVRKFDAMLWQMLGRVG